MNYTKLYTSEFCRKNKEITRVQRRVAYSYHYAYGLNTVSLFI